VSALKKINPNLKAIFSLGGYAAGTAIFTAVSADATKRATMAQSAIEFCQTYDFDGIDVDWEYPLEGDRVSSFCQLVDTS
jgi:chitinase